MASHQWGLCYTLHVKCAPQAHMFQNLVLSRSRERSEWWRAGFEGQSQADLASALILCFLMADQLFLAPSQQHCHKCEPTPLPWWTEPFQTVSPKQQQQQIFPPPRLSCPNWLFVYKKKTNRDCCWWVVPGNGQGTEGSTERLQILSTIKWRTQGWDKDRSWEVHYKNMPHPRAAVLNLGVMTPLGIIYQIYCKYQIFIL